MSPTPSPSPIDVAATLSTITSVATAVGNALNVPSIPQSVIYIVAILGGLALTFFGQKFLSGWLNEVKAPGNETSAGDGKSTTDTSASSVQSQTNQLPKD